MNDVFFILRPDIYLNNVIRPIGLPYAKELKQMPGYVPFFLEDQIEQEYPDYMLSQPYPRNTRRLVSDKLKRILQKYSPHTFFKSLVFIDLVDRRQEVYWLMEPPALAAISPLSQIDRLGLPAGRIHKLVLERDKIGSEIIFTLSDTFAPFLIVNRAVAESVLRRDAWGIEFERIQTV